MRTITPYIYYTLLIVVYIFFLLIYKTDFSKIENSNVHIFPKANLRISIIFPIWIIKIAQMSCLHCKVRFRKSSVKRDGGIFFRVNVFFFFCCWYFRGSFVSPVVCGFLPGRSSVQDRVVGEGVKVCILASQWCRLFVDWLL